MFVLKSSVFDGEGEYLVELYPAWRWLEKQPEKGACGWEHSLFGP